MADQKKKYAQTCIVAGSLAQLDGFKLHYAAIAKK